MSWEDDRLIISHDGHQAFRDVLAESVGKKCMAINADTERPEQGLAKLVLTLIELLRRLLEQEALRQIDRDQLTDTQIERMGCAFEQLDIQMHQLLAIFGLSEHDLNLDLGPLGTLM